MTQARDEQKYVVRIGNVAFEMDYQIIWMKDILHVLSSQSNLQRDENVMLQLRGNLLFFPLRIRTRTVTCNTYTKIAWHLCGILRVRIYILHSLLMQNGGPLKDLQKKKTRGSPRYYGASVSSTAETSAEQNKRQHIWAISRLRLDY